MRKLCILFLVFVFSGTSNFVRANESGPLDVQYEVGTGGTTPTKPAYILNPYAQEELARYIFRFKTTKDGGIWNVCGKSLTPSEMKQTALEYAKELLIAHNTVTYTVRKNGAKKTVKVPLKGVLGTMMSESRLDYCAIGPHPRKWAYKQNLLEKKPKGIRGTPSYSREKVLKVLNHPKWNNRLADLGLAQIVWGRSQRAIYQGNPEDLLSLRPGVRKVFEEMADRGQRKNSMSPWEYWPGERRHQWYDSRISRFANVIFNPPLSDF